MKRITLFLSIVCFTILSTSCPYRHYSREKFPGYGKGAIVYLHVLKEDGKPMEDSHAKDFILDYCERSTYKDVRTVINENDELIFECSEFYASYQEEEPTEEEMKKTLDNGYWFALKDTTGHYKTVRRTYKETYDKYEKNPNPGHGYGHPSYIYHCKIQLQKKS